MRVICFLNKNIFDVTLQQAVSLTNTIIAKINNCVFWCLRKGFLASLYALFYSSTGFLKTKSFAKAFL